MLTLNDGRSELWQWDTGRTLSVPDDCSQVHFSNKVFGRSIDVDVVDGVADIPDILLQTDKDLTALAFVGTAENGYTKISKVFKVNQRNKPADYVFTPTEQTTLGKIMERLDELESIQDPDAIKNAVDDYLANNPIKVNETDPTVSNWAKEKEKPKYTADEVGALSKTELSGAVNDALAQAKASGEFDGKDGQDGSDGVSATHSWNGTVLTVTSASGTSSADLKGEPGKDGNPGKDGYTPQKGIDYFDGNDGKDGQNGSDYVLTEADKQEIAELTAPLVDVPGGGGSGGSAEWELVADVTLAEDTQSIEYTELNAQELRFMFEGRFNDADDTLANANAEVFFHLSNNAWNVPIGKGNFGYVRTGNFNSVAVGEAKIIAGFGCVHSMIISGGLNATGQADSGRAHALEIIPRLKIETATSGQLFKAGGRFVLYKKA